MWFILLFKNPFININQNKDITPQTWKLFIDRRIYQFVSFPLDWRIENSICWVSVKNQVSILTVLLNFVWILTGLLRFQYLHFSDGQNNSNLGLKDKAIFQKTQTFIFSRTRIENIGCLVARWDIFPSCLAFSKCLIERKQSMFTL